MNILLYNFLYVSGYNYSGYKEVAKCWVQLPRLGVSGEDVV